MNETGNIFYDELMGKLQNIEDALLDVKSGLLDEENINEIFRSMHTIKGTADLLGMLEVVSLTHKSEDLLSEIRDDNIEFTDEICDLLLELKKFIALLIGNILNGVELTNDTTDLIAEFENELSRAMVNDTQDIEQERILVLDESFIIRGQIKEHSEKLGFSTTISANFEDALMKYYQHKFDIVIVDIDTKDIGGSQMLNEIYEHDKDIKIVLLTAAKTKNLALIAGKIKAKAWLLKPVKIHMLNALLKKLKD
jgi:chemotaxis protein histidine kinase CheA